MARGDSIVRQWKILQSLQACRNGMTAGLIADELNIRVRTVYRDLEVLQAAGFPLYTVQRGQNSFWKMQSDEPEGKRP